MPTLNDLYQEYARAKEDREQREAVAKQAEQALAEAVADQAQRDSDFSKAIHGRPNPLKKIFFTDKEGDPWIIIPDDDGEGFQFEEADSMDVEVNLPDPPPPPEEPPPDEG